MRQKFSMAKFASPGRARRVHASAAGAAVSAQDARLADNAPHELHRAERRHPLGHLRQVPQGPVALAGRLADEPRADQEPAPHLPGRRRPPRLRRRAAAALARRRRRAGHGPRVADRRASIAARPRGDPEHSARTTSSRTCRGRSSPAPTGLRRLGRDRRRPRPRARDPRRGRRRLRRSASTRRPATSGTSTGPPAPSSTSTGKRGARLREQVPRHRARRALRRPLDRAHRATRPRRSSSATG